MKTNQYFKFLKFMWKYLKNEKLLVIVITLSIMAHAVFSIGIPILTQVLIDNILTLYEEGYLLWIILALILVPIISGSLMVLEDYSANKLGHKVLTNMRIRLFSKQLKAEYLSSSNSSSGARIQTIIDEPDEIGHWIYITSIQVLLNFLCTILIFGMLFYLDVGLGTLALVLLFLNVIPYMRYQKKLQHISGEEFKWRGISTSILSESLKAVPLFKSFRKTDYLQSRFEKINASQQKLFLRSLGLESKSNALIGAVMAVGVALIYFYGGMKVINGELSVGAIIAAKMYIETLFLRNQMLYHRLIETSKKIPIARKIEKEDSDPYLNQDEGNSGVEFTEEVNSIILKRVSLDYEEKPVFQNLDASFPIGKYSVIVGPSGTGKSSLIKLLFGMIKPSSGSILVNDHPLTSINLDQFRDKVQYVPQDSQFFNLSIYENITFGIENVDHNYLNLLIEKFGLEKFINQLPENWETIIGDSNGVKLSGGQLRLVAIVRALIRKPEILLLDEASSGIDSKNILNFQNAIRDLRGVTVISVSHNQDEAEHADSVLDILSYSNFKNNILN